MKKIRFLLPILCILFFKFNSTAQNCGIIYGQGYSGTGSSIGTRQFSFAANTWNGAPLESTAYFNAPNTIKNGGPIAIDPINQQINVLTDATNPHQVALFTFGSAPFFVSLPASYNALPQLYCSGYTYNSHRCYYMTGSIVGGVPQAFISVDFTNVSAANTVAVNTAALITKTYTCSLAPGAPNINMASGGDICFDMNGTGYLVTASKQLYTIVTNEVSNTAMFTYIASLSALSFAPTAVAFDPANNKLTMTGATQTVSEYNLSTNLVTQLTTASGYIAPDLASCFYPNIKPALKVTKALYDSTQHKGPSDSTFVIVATNDILEYTITVTDTGNVNAGNFTIADPIPAGTSYVPNSTRMNGIAVADSAGGVFPFHAARAANSGNQAASSGILTVYTNASPAKPASVITYLVKVTTSSATPVVNTATASVTGSSPTTPLTATGSVTFSVGTILKVTLTSFTAVKENNKVKIDWGTSNEAGNDRYEVERSNNGNEYTTIGIVMAVDSNEPFIRNYSFTDGSPAPGNNFYRLKQVDINGALIYSYVELVSFDVAPEEALVQLYPNPVNGTTVTLSLGASHRQINAAVINALGQQVSNQRFTNASINVLLNINALAKGLYYIQIVADDKLLKPAKLIIN